MYNEQNIDHHKHLIVQDKYWKMNVANKQVNIDEQYNLQSEQII